MKETALTDDTLQKEVVCAEGALPEREDKSAPTPAFDLFESELNSSILIEASAGTGKTYSLNHIILRLLVEEAIPIHRILVVTFTKSATAQMVSRLRTLLSSVTEALQEEREAKEDGRVCEPVDGSGLFSELDPNLQHQYRRWVDVIGISPETVLERLEAALAAIDDAAIYTIHSFCQRMLQDFVFAAQGSFETEVIEPKNDLLVKAIDTVIREEASWMSDDGARLALLQPKMGERYVTFLEALSDLTRTKPYSEQAVVINGKFPEGEDASQESGAPSEIKGEESPVSKEDSQTALLNATLTDAVERFIERAPEEYRRLKQEARVTTFSDMLVDMEEQIFALPEFRRAVEQRFDAVLIDEFQDTDPLQFAIFRSLFLAEDKEAQKPLIFVGDPKQSIYRFRSADLNTYLAAREEVAAIYALKKNFRSAPAIIEAVNAIYSNACPMSFLNPRIAFEAVESSARGALFELLPDGARRNLPPFTLWVFGEKLRESFCPNPADFVKPQSQDIYRQEARLIADDIVRLTAGNVYLETKAGVRPVRPSDVCILVRKRRDAQELTQEFRSRNIRYIIKSDESVFASSEARELEVLLTAMENPKNRNAMANARATNIFGETLRGIDADTDKGLEARLQIEEAALNVEHRGVLSAFRTLFRKRRVEKRLLPTAEGERMLTNYDHLLELLHTANRRIKTVSGLLRWLAARSSEKSTEERYKLRLESDSDLVRIETIHNSKGLEFPIVYLLKQTKGRSNNGHPSAVFRVERDGQKVLWLNIGKDLRESELKEEEQAQLQEEARLLYVALTRAGSYLAVPYLLQMNNPDKKTGVFGWRKGSANNALGRALTGRFEPEEREVLQALAALEEKVTAAGGVLIEVDPVSASQWSLRQKMALEDDSELAVAEAARVRSDWGRTSFTGMTQSIEEQAESPSLDEDSEEEVAEVSEEDSASPEAARPLGASHPDPFRYKDAKMPATAYGDFVHKLLEAVPFDASNRSEIEEKVTEVFRHLDVKSALPEGEDALTEKELRSRHIAALTDMVEAMLGCVPLAPLPDFRLSQLTCGTKVSEMGFLLANPAEDASSTQNEPLTAAQLGEALRLLDQEKYGDLNLSEKHEIAGYLSGSIDLMFLAGGRFWIIDWKTNFLAENSADYRGAVLEEAMRKKHYKLQYLLYLVALKRHLELRLGLRDGYSVIGGASYLFLRGVEADSAQGIYFERPEAAVIDCLDDLLRNGFDPERIARYKSRMVQSNNETGERVK